MNSAASFLTGACRQGSKLGHVAHGDVTVYWICRDPLLELDGRVLYEDMAIVGHNARTGATCFWDDVNEVMHDGDSPPLDLEAASDDERARFVERFTYTDGSSCIGCHDHDPFIYTPYLASTGWESIATDGPYHLVELSGAPRATRNLHLVSDEASPCTSCHRLGSEETCSFFAPDALGDKFAAGYEAEVRAAAEVGSPHWRLAHWMPEEGVDDYSAWEAKYAAAAEHILGCCDEPDAAGCEWAEVPAG